MDTNLPSKFQERNSFLDIAKGIGIFLMIFGHNILNGNGEYVYHSKDTWSAPLLVFIYSFHMPLFMLISGYLFYFSLNRNVDWKNILCKRFKHILFPIIIFNFYVYIAMNSQVYQSDLYVMFNLERLLFRIFDGFWFLWAILCSSVLVIFVKYFAKDSKLLYFLILIALFFIPNKVFGLQTYRISFVYGFFVLAYLFAERIKVNTQKINENYGKIWLISTIIFFICLPFFSYENYIYFSGYNILNPLLNVTLSEQLWLNIYRFIIGLSGSVFILFLINKIYQSTKDIFIWKFFGYLGTYSLGFYCIQELLISFGVKVISKGYFEINYLINFFQSLCVIFLCTIFIELLKKNDLLKKFHLG
ncbi:acyltransferase family protein [Actinobacillus equuli]|uniref:acyltransferase family protein n=1 Tax=Actinobacillus equuli TaxID=718 RepID=UPI002442136F|nr:acyltransferase family protein [Actinobacillus equuli]WGE59217.1 acyltransferase family protein [Actinobacillus equuli subsp. haemolyticus]WGE62142.1 acyltransferase family protein [Actinobacillus equuli subsp. haemolyticus]